MYLYNGMEIVVSNQLPIKKTQARKHKKKRINKKWLKIYGYKPLEYTSFVFMNKLMVHPLVFEKLKNSKDVIKI